ncbi:MAG: Ig-like domain repeat protein, partial [Akkermansiaceae bacterium]|nr:Ig-like domain repeat protein [Akkermansiaceae bacterium]
MKTPIPDHPIRNTLKHLALASTMGAAMFFGASPASAAPPVTAGLKLHLDASALTGLNDGDTVTTWTDVSGSGNNATATAGGSAATYETNELNGLPVVRFNANNNTNFDFTRISTIRTVFWVLKKTNSSQQFLLGDSDQYHFHDANPNLWDATYASAFIRNGTTKLMGTVVNGTSTALPSSSYSLLSLVTTGNVQANRLSRDRIYGRSWAGDMAEVLIYDRALTTEEEELVGGYLAGKYDLMTTYPTELAVRLTSPGNNEAYLSGTSISATAAVVSGTAPYTVKFFTRSLPGGTFAQAGVDLTDSPYTLDLGTLSDGSYEIYATVTDSADPPVTATSATHTFTVASPTATTTTLATAGPPTTYGDSVTFTATVSPPPTGGTVQFYSDFDFLGAPVAVNPTTGEATISTTKLYVGTNDITAEYLGYQIYEPSTTAAAIQQEVGKAELTVTAHNKVRAPGVANPTLTYQISGYQNGETLATSGVSGEPILACAALPSDPVGDYPITCDATPMSAADYSFTAVAGTLSVVEVVAQLAYEGFDYAPGAVAGQNGGSGFSGAWSNLETSGTGIDVMADGLVFSNLLVSGGRIEAQALQNGGKSRVQRDLSANAPGQIYGSYLYRRNSTIDDTTVAGLMIGVPGEGDNDSTAAFYADEWFQNVGARVEANMGTWSGDRLTAGETFLVLFSSNLNDGLQTATMWVLNKDQFDTFKAGGLTEAELNAASVGTGSSDVWAKATTQGPDDTLDPVNNFKFMAYGGWGPPEGILVSFDELRLSQTSLDEVAPVISSEAFPLTITPNAGTAGNYDFVWTSQAGKLYDLVSSTDLSTPPASWDVWQGQADIEGTAPTNMLEDIPGGGDPSRFFAVLEKNPP